MPTEWYNDCMLEYAYHRKFSYEYDNRTFSDGLSLHLHIKNKYFNNIKAYIPRWKQLLYKASYITPNLNKWLTLCIELNTAANDADFQQLTKFIPPQILQTQTNNKPSIYSLLRKTPQIANAFYKGISENKQSLYEAKILQLIFQTDIEDIEKLYLYAILEATPEQTKTYETLPKEYITAML